MKGARVPVAPDGWRFLIPLVAGGVVFLLLGWRLPAALFGVVFLFFLYFFRDPERSISGDTALVLSPADGTVSTIERVEEGGNLWRVGIFLSVFNVHVNRVPLRGRVDSVEHTPGRFLPAYDREASRVNERNRVVIHGNPGPVVVTQIAGVLARRIVCWVRRGQELEAGERLGLIRFGSRVEVVLPPGVTPTVNIGERVKGGISVLARLGGSDHGLV